MLLPDAGIKGNLLLSGLSRPKIAAVATE